VDWILTGTMLTSNFLIGRKRIIGWVLFVITSLMWVWYAVALLDPPQYGLAMGAVANILIGSYSGYRWYVER